MDDWKEHHWISDRLKAKSLTADDLKHFNVDDFRYFCFGTTENNVHDIMDLVFKNMSILPEELIPELIRYIEITSNHKLMSKLVTSRHPAILIHVISNHPEMFDVSDDELAMLMENEEYSEIIYHICTIDWKKLNQESKWTKFFKVIVNNRDSLQEFLVDYILTSPNCSLEQLLEAVRTFAEKPVHLQLVYALINTKDITIFETNSELFTELFSLAMDNAKACKELLTNLLKSKAASKNVDTIVKELKSQRLNPLLRELYRTLATNQFIPAKTLMNKYAANVPLMKGLVQRADLLDSIYLEELLGFEDDDLIATFLDKHGRKITWGQLILDNMFARVFNGGFMTGIALAGVPNLPMDAMDNIADTNEIARLTLSRRDDLPLIIRDRLLKDDDIDIQCGVLRSEDRAEVLLKFYSLDIKYDESIAANRKLPQELRGKLLSMASDKAFRVHRTLALRDDITSSEVDILLLKRDLDVYHNLCLNPKIPLSREHVLVLTNFAQVPEEEQAAWLPCLRLMHKKKKDDELCKMLVSYQSECRLLLLQLDKEHNLKRIDEEMKIGWISDPDYSLTLGIINDSKTLSNYMMNLIVDNEANAGLIEDKLLMLLDRCEQGISYETLKTMLKKGKANVSRKILQLLAMSLTGKSLFVLASGTSTLKAEQSAAFKNNEVFKDPIKFVVLVREIFNSHKAVADIMKGCIQLLKTIISTFHDKYSSNEDHFKTKVDDLLLDICTDFRVPTACMDEMISISSPTILCHILNFGNLNHDTLWSIFLREVTTSGTRGPVLRCLALRDSLPASLRFTLALLQSNLSKNTKDVDAMILETNNNTAPEHSENELLHLLLSTRNKLPKEIVHYYLACEPQEIISFLHSAELTSIELGYIKDFILSKIDDHRSPILTHFESFVAAVQSLAGYSVELKDIDFTNVTSKVITDTISYARGGIELQMLPDFLTKTLGLKVPTDEIKILLDALMILFTYETEEEKKEREARTRANRTFDKSRPDQAQDDEAEEDVPVTSLPINSIVKAKEQFGKIVLSCDIRQYLVPYLDKGYLAIQADPSKPLVVVPEKYEVLFGSSFAEAINHQIERFLSYHFSSEITKRQKQFTQENFKSILKTRNLTVAKVQKFVEELEIPTCQVYSTVQMLVEFGIGECYSRDLGWLVSQLYDITESIQPSNIEQSSKKRKTDSEQSTSNDEKRTFSPTEVQEILLTPMLQNATDILSLPYVAVFRFSELLPDITKQKFPHKVLHLLAVWGRPEETEKRTLSELLHEVEFIVDMLSSDSNVAFLQQVLKCVNSLLLSIKFGHLTYNKALKEKESTSDTNDALVHECNLELLEDKVYNTIKDIAEEACKKMNRLFSTQSLKSLGATVSFCNFDSQTKPISEMKSMELLSAELLNKIVQHKAASTLSSTSTLYDICTYISPFNHIINISPITYRVGTTGQIQMTPGNLFFRFQEFLPEDRLRNNTLKNLLNNLEMCDFCVHKVESIWKNSKEAMNDISSIKIEELLVLKSPHNFILLNNDLLQECKDKVAQTYKNFLNDKITLVKQILSFSDLTLAAVPDFEHTTKATVYEAEPVPGLFLVQHALQLDEDSMPIINDKGELLRDETSEKTRQPVMNVVQVEKQLPTLKEVAQKLNESDLLSLIPAFHIPMIRNTIQEFEDRLLEAVSLVFTSISKPHLDELVASLEQTLKQGVKLSCPSGKPGPAYQYLVQLKSSVFGARVDQIRTRNINLNINAEDQIKAFAISRRPTLPQEMIKYLVLLEKCSFKEESKVRRLCEAAICAAVMKSDINYHVLLDDTTVVKYLYDILLRIGDKLMLLESEKQRGSLLVAFPCSTKGLGIMCISSHFREDTSEWERYIHYNSNACAAEEYTELLKESPPLDLGNGVIYECTFSGANKRNIILSFTENAIASKKSSLHKQAIDVIEEGNIHDESNLGQNLNLGQINWVRRSEGKVSVNHLHCEAALCNASPMIPLTRVNGKLVIKTSFNEVINQLVSIEGTWAQKKKKK